MACCQAASAAPFERRAATAGSLRRPWDDRRTAGGRSSQRMRGRREVAGPVGRREGAGASGRGSAYSTHSTPRRASGQQGCGHGIARPHGRGGRRSAIRGLRTGASATAARRAGRWSAGSRRRRDRSVVRSAARRPVRSATRRPAAARRRAAVTSSARAGRESPSGLRPRRRRAAGRRARLQPVDPAARSTAARPPHRCAARRSTGRPRSRR